MELAKTHILFPKQLLKQIDKRVGVGFRSKFVIEAAQEKLARFKALEAMESAAGSWTSKNHPSLKNQKDINRYLKKTRIQTHRRMSRRLNG